MEFWSESGRPRLIAALEAACDAVQNDLAAVVQQHAARNASLEEELSKLRAAAARVDRLETENRSLLQELSELRKKGSSKDKDVECLQSRRPALAEISANSRTGSLIANIGSSNGGLSEQPKLDREYSKLAKQYAALLERYKVIHRAATKFRRLKNDWEKYAVSLEGKTKSLEKKLRRYESADNQLFAHSTARRHGSAESAHCGSLLGRTAIGSRSASDAGTEAGSGCQSHEDAGEETSEEPTENEIVGADRLPQLRSSMAETCGVTVKQEPSSDVPVVVSERSLRKRKHQDEDTDAPGTSHRIKREQNTSSDPIITAEIPIFRPHESMDFDEDAYGTPTPRKQRLRAPEAEIFRDDKLPLELHHAERDSENITVDTPCPVLKTHLGRPPASAPSMDKPEATHRDGRLVIKPEWTLDAAIADVGEDTVQNVYSPKVRETPGRVTPAYGRLRALLQRGSPDQQDTPLRPTRQSRGTRGSPSKPDGAKGTPQGLLRPPETHAKASPNTVTPKQPQEKPSRPKPPRRLRDRPLAELRAEDFKVNPRFNSGYNYAFDEVVRSRDERAELAGCTDSNCCGPKFRAMAESELSAGGPAVLSREADTKMLEKYLGDDAYRLRGMTQQEKKEVWLKAKTQDLADKYGRHRHRFARRPSPPGYWNPDFPSTQEIAKSKEEGERMERQVVEERWREAMRGGRWLFRDE
ncbi:hypothetical protein VTK26DRAFT_3213 [Humicola hyalothermophila]